MSSIYYDDRLSLSQVANLLGVHVATVWRWTKHGVRGRRLQTVAIGGRRYVLQRDLDSFVQGERPDTDDSRRQRRADSAGHLLDSLGVKDRRGDSAT